MKPDLGLAARTLALDLATGEVVRAINQAAIDCIVLKGPAMAHRLYGDAPGCRNYGDIDLAVAPARFDDAGRVLAALGFEDQRAGIRASEAARLHERPWHRDGEVYVAVDLHRGFHNVADRSAWWAALEQHREVLVVEGEAVYIPDAVGCALVAGLHASKAAQSCKPLEDLRRAIEQLDDDVWRQAADLARTVGAGAALGAALYRQSAGAALAHRLGLDVTDPAVWFLATSNRRGTGSLSIVLEPGTAAARVRRLRDLTFPSQVLLAESRPVARRGAGGVSVARLGRLGLIVTRLPPLLLAWCRSALALRRGRGRRR